MLYFYHYYEKETGPFVNLSELSLDDAQKIQDGLKKDPVFAAQRNTRYLSRRRYLEQLVRELFIDKGGRPVRQTPYYMVVGACPWLKTWYKAGEYLKIPVSDFDLETVSFTYGDMFPTFSPKITDGMEYRNTVYTYTEILDVIDRYGLPQDRWNEPVFAQPAYVEVQVWSEDPISQYKART